MKSSQLKAWAIVLALVAGSASWAWPRVNRVTASPVYQRWVWLTPGWHYLQTTGTSAGGDPVLHVWGPRYSGTAYIGDGEAGRDDDSGGGVEAFLWVNVPVASWFRAIVHNENPGQQGTTNLYVDGAVVASSVAFAGNRIGFPGGTPAFHVHESALAPNGPSDTVLYGIACSGEMIAFDDNGGVGTAARLSGPSGICWVWLSSGTQPAGPAFLYVNDWSTDTDGDGLGRALEDELGTCDGDSLSYCSTIYNTQDSDRDGLSDTAEICGIDDPALPQHLPRWGATPTHKDVFVEVDYTDEFATQPVVGADATAMQALYNTGAAADLINPDGTPGIRLHFDIGIPPATTTVATLYGAWGGSSRSTDRSYPSAADTERAVVRRGVFHYALAGLGWGGGQGYHYGDRLGWGVQTWERFVQSFAHELGHNLGLGHDGHSSWGGMNCKPNYRSLMNYAFGGDGFSLGLNTRRINPADAYEPLGTGGDATYLSTNPFFLNATPTQVDWNRDGAYSGWVRAPVTWATWVGCDAMVQNWRTVIEDGSMYAASPELVKVGSRLYLFYVGSDERVHYRQGAVSGLGWHGSCPGGGALGDTCMTWGPDQLVPTLANVRSVTALEWGGGVLLAIKTHLSSVRTLSAGTVDVAGNFTGWTTDTWFGANTAAEPELSRVYVDPARFGTSEVIGLFYVEAGQHKWYTATSRTGPWAAQGQLLDTEGVGLTGAIGPGVINWPSRGAGISNAAIGTACGAFPNAANEAGFFCYEKPTHRWKRVSGAFPATATVNAKPSLMYHTFRSTWGSPLAGNVRGQFMLATIAGSGPTMWISDALDTTNPPELTFFRNYGAVGNAWTNLVPATNVTMYEDLDLAAAKGTWTFMGSAAGRAHLQFFPQFDGSVWTSLADGNDFRVMERGICAGMRGNDYCGATNTWGY